MKTKRDTKFVVVDVLLILMMVLPFVAGIVLKVLTSPAEEGISVSGSLIYFTIHMPFQDMEITESQIVSLIVIISSLGLCLYLTHGIAVVPNSRRQLVAEFLVEQVENMVNTNMGEHFASFAPFIGGILVLSALSSLSALLGLHPPTSDINIVAGWALLTFILITYEKMQAGPLNYLKGFTEPIPLFAPFNVISEIATPISMSFRHYGNVLSGVVIDMMIGVALENLSKALLGWLTGLLGWSYTFPLLRVGLPAVLSLYFDLFSGCLQAFIFAMLTMLYVGGGYPADAVAARKAKKAARQAA